MENSVVPSSRIGNMPITPNSQDGKISAYNPKEYGFIGFIFGLIPVFVMSFSNAKIFPNGEEIKAKMKIYLWIYVLGYLALIAFSFFAVYTFYSDLKSASDSTIFNAAGMDDDSAIASISPLFMQFIRYSDSIFFGFNLVLLILVYKFTKKTELPVYTQLKENGQLNARRFLVPVLIGIALPLALYFVLPKIFVLVGESVLQ